MRFIAVIDFALNVDSSMSVIAALNCTAPSACSNRTGIFVVNLYSIHSSFTPKIESYGPVIPRSVIKAVPFAKILASEVCTCVCVPTTAVTVPSAEESKVFPELTVVQYHYHTTTSLVAVYPTFPYLSI